MASLESDDDSNLNDKTKSDESVKFGGSRSNKFKVLAKYRRQSSALEHIAAKAIPVQQIAQPVIPVYLHTDHHTDQDDELEAPDGGWGWAVVFGVLLTTMIHCSFTNVFPIIYAEVRDRFNCSAEAASWMSAIHYALKLFLSIIIVGILHFVNARTLTIIGTLFLSVGYIVTAFAKTIGVAIFGYGVLGGIGAALVITSSLVIVSEYFNKLKSRAMAIGFCGPCLGSILGSLIMSQLYERYSFFGTLIIFAGISLNTAVAGMLYVPLVGKKKAKIIRLNSTVEEKTRFRTLLTSSLNFFNVKVLKNANFLFFVLYSLMLEIVTACGNIFTFAYGHEFGVSIHNMAGIILIEAASAIISRVCFGFLLDFRPIKPYRIFVYIFANILMSIGYILMGSFQVKEVFYFLFLFVRAFSGIALSQMTNIATDTIRRDQIKEGIGLLRFFTAFSMLIGPAIGGRLVDITKSNGIVFITGGYFLLSVSIVYMIFQYFMFFYHKNVPVI